MMFKWFASKSVRTATDMCKHVGRLLSAQKDILSPQAVAALETASRDTRQSIAQHRTDDELKKQMAALETAANKWLKPYPHAVLRENVEVLLVALAVAMGIRTFFLQPFKIPTGSMQPTLYGVTPAQYSGNQFDLKIPGRIARFFDYWTHGNSYFDELAPSDGQLQVVRQPVRLLLFNLLQTYQFNNENHIIWFPADELFQRVGYQLGAYGTVLNPQPLKAGDPIVRLKVVAGDHLFVDRLSYNFRHPKRGEIIVFETRGTPIPQQGEFYIKRLVALGGERVQIGEDRHLIIDGRRLDKTEPHFENVYGFDPTQEAMESHYSGHVYRPELAPRFASTPDHAVTVRPEHYMVMGDNTLNSSDSRVWGDFSRTNVIGKYFFVYWPFSPRFGWNVR